MWKDVLRMLHDEMEVLEWVSLRRIDYANNFDAILANTGNEVPEYDFMLSSEDDNENVEGLGDDHISEGDDEEDDQQQEEESADDESSEDMDSDDGHDDDHGPSANELALSPDTPASAPWSFSSGASHLPKTADELGDNGVDVLYEQRKFWEQWVVAKPRS